MECGGDGIIVSTPTGSTAYSLSAGGPIVEPDARNIIITPVCALDMLSRSMVMSDKRIVTVQMVQNVRRNAFLSVDGGKAIRMNMGDVAIIKKSRLETRLVRLNDRSFYEVLNTKFQKN
jgi:NAD+ kinase